MTDELWDITLNIRINTELDSWLQKQSDLLTQEVGQGITFTKSDIVRRMIFAEKNKQEKGGQSK